MDLSRLKLDVLKIFRDKQNQLTNMFIEWRWVEGGRVLRHKATGTKYVHMETTASGEVHCVDFDMFCNMFILSDKWEPLHWFIFQGDEVEFVEFLRWDEW